MLVIAAAAVVFSCQAPPQEPLVDDAAGAEDADLEKDLQGISNLDQELDLSELDEIDIAIKELEE